MTDKKEPPRRIAVLQKGLVDNNHQRHSSSFQKPVNMPIKAQGKIIGYLTNHTFIKQVQGSKHMLRKPPGWCISKEAFCEQILPNTETIVVEDAESGLIYECRTTVFSEHAFEIQRGNFEPQLALGLKFWEVRGNGRHQLSLWGGESDAL